MAVSLGGAGRSHPAGESPQAARPATTEKVGLGWNASLGHDAKTDPKVSADKRGHRIGVSLDVYKRPSIEEKTLAAGKLKKRCLVRWSGCQRRKFREKSVNGIPLWVL